MSYNCSGMLSDWYFDICFLVMIYIFKMGVEINIVVYNKACKEVLNSIFFDTHFEENTMTSRINETGIVENEIGINIWEKVS